MPISLIKVSTSRSMLVNLSMPQAGLSDYGFSAFNANAEAVWHAAIKVRTASGEYARVYMIVEELCARSPSRMGEITS
jgi:hypothetical protein